MFLASALAALALAAAGPDAAQSAQSNAQAPVASTTATPTLDTKSAEKTRRVCVDKPALAGSRLGRKSCRVEKVGEKAAPVAGMKAEPEAKPD